MRKRDRCYSKQQLATDDEHGSTRYLDEADESSGEGVPDETETVAKPNTKP